MRTFISVVLTALSLASVASAVTLRQLTSDTFTPTVAKGLWMVEHFSPQCAHCIAFGPTWEKLVEEKQHLESITGFHMAQVNCLAQGDLCEANVVRQYPDIRVYQDGVELDPYRQSRTHDLLSQYIDTVSTRYARRSVLASSQADSQIPKLGGGETGEVVKLDAAGLDRIKREGGFVKFFAPWCGHCKHLAPTWRELAMELSGRITVAELDCDALPKVCKAEGVPGYPMMFLYAAGQRYEFTGSRTLAAMTSFASKAASAGELENINADSIEAIVKREEVFFVYLHTYSSDKDDLTTVMQASRSLIGSAVVFQSRDPELFKLTGVDPLGTPGVLLSFKDHKASPPLATLSFSPPPTTAAVATFLEDNKLPTLVDLDSGNFGEVMRNKRGSLVVLAGLRTGDAKKLEEEKAKMRVIASSWRKKGRKLEQGVIFAWMDGNRWAKWLKQNYGMTTANMPGVVVANPSKNEYFDITLELERIAFDGASIFSTLEGVYQNKLKPRTIESMPSRLMRAVYLKVASWQQSAYERPLMTFLAFVGVAALGMFIIKRCVQLDYPEQQHHKLTSRLD